MVDISSDHRAPMILALLEEFNIDDQYVDWPSIQRDTLQFYRDQETRYMKENPHMNESQVNKLALTDTRDHVRRWSKR
jgi:hypothetical protein